jgi:transposase
MHAAVDTLGHLLALHVTSRANWTAPRSSGWPKRSNRSPAAACSWAYVDHGYTGQTAADAAAKHGIQLQVVKHTEPKRGFVLLPKRWVVERSFAWAARFRRLASDYERLDHSLAGYRYFAFAWIMLAQLAKLLNKSS